jgi:hypothetical protein
MLLQNSERFFPSDGSAQSRSDPRIWPLLIVYCHLLASAFSFNLWWDFDTKSHRVWIDRTFAVLVLICALIASFYSGGFVFSASTCLCAVVLYFFGSRHFERRKSWSKELLTHLSFRGMLGLAVLYSHFFSPWELTPAEVGANALRALGFVLPHLLASYLYIVLVLKRLKKRPRKGGAGAESPYGMEHYFVGFLATLLYIYCANFPVQIMTEASGNGTNCAKHLSEPWLKREGARGAILVEESVASLEAKEQKLDSCATAADKYGQPFADWPFRVGLVRKSFAGDPSNDLPDFALFAAAFVSLAILAGGQRPAAWIQRVGAAAETFLGIRASASQTQTRE